MTSSSRVLAILDLFTAEHPNWHTDAIIESLGYSRATGYRYVKELVDSGFLQKAGAGRYALGARIVELDYRLRESDPVLLASLPVMDALARQTHLHAVLSAMYGGFRVVDVHRVDAGGSPILRYGRGRPRPLFRGAGPMVLLAYQPRAKLIRIYGSRRTDIEAAGLGATWAAFRARMVEIRKRRAYLSLGEVDPGVGAVGVPILDFDGDAVASLALVGELDAIKTLGETALAQILRAAASEITERMAALRPNR